MSKLWNHTTSRSGIRHLMMDWSVYGVNRDYFAKPDVHEVLKENAELSAGLVAALVNESEDTRSRGVFDVNAVEHYYDKEDIKEDTKMEKTEDNA